LPRDNSRHFYWLLELANAGHWSFTDIAGVVPDLMPGCGIPYLDPAKAREITIRYVTAFFERTLSKRPGSLLDVAAPTGIVTLSHHP
jgi:hypothetical protein